MLQGTSSYVRNMLAFPRKLTTTVDRSRNSAKVLGVISNMILTDDDLLPYYLALSGETVTGSRSETLHGGKGANQVSLNSYTW